MTSAGKARLEALASRYQYDAKAAKQKIRETARSITRNSAVMVDTAGIAIASEVNFEELEDASELSDPTNLETLRLKYSRKWQEILGTPNAEKVLDANGNPYYVHGFADKHLEVSIRDHLNNGGFIGGYSLPEGYTAIVPENPSFPTIDIRVVNPYGDEMPGIQVKLTERAQYLRETLRGLDERWLGEVLAANADAPNVEGVEYSPFTREGMLDEGAEYLDAATEPAAEALGEEAVADVAFVGGIQGIRLSVRMIRNLRVGRRLADGIDARDETFTFFVNGVATGVSNVVRLADLAVPGVGTAAAIGTKASIHTVRNRMASATALDLAIARVANLAAKPAA